MTTIETDARDGSAALPRSSDWAGDNQVESETIDIACDGLVKVFKDFWGRDRVRAVDDVDLQVKRGEVLGLLGPNGSGKSTTIKMILGLLRPTKGMISVLGRRPDDVATKKQIGYLPEDSYLYRFLNARETLDFYGKLFHQDRAQRRARIDTLLDMVGLTAVQRRPVGEFSKGMQRRIGLAQALINDPQLLILDEPTTGMDPIGTRQIKDLILELRNRGKTILLCSHLLTDVEDVCDRVAIMYGGKVRRLGACDDLLVQEDHTTIQTPVLSDAMIAKIEALLETEGQSIEKVEQPRQRLENYFLDIVAEAQSQGVMTSGARSDGRIADFLVGAAAPAGEVEEVRGDAVVDELMHQADSPEEEVVQSADGDADGADDAADTVDDVVSQLVASPDPLEKQVQVEATVDPEPEADLSVIDGLMNDEAVSAESASLAASWAQSEESDVDEQPAAPSKPVPDAAPPKSPATEADGSERPDESLRDSIDSMLDDDSEGDRKP